MRRLLTLITLYWATNAHAQGLSFPLEQGNQVTCDFCGYQSASGSCHGGIDYRARETQSVRAAEGGTVMKVVTGLSNTRSLPFDPGTAYGNHVRVRNSQGRVTIYAHLAAASVAEGDVVAAGAILGTTDNSGWSTGPHLHFEVRDSGGRRLDPYGERADRTSCTGAFTPNCGPGALWGTCSCTTTCPSEMALIAAGCFCIDRYEASVAEGVLGMVDGTGTTAIAQSIAGVLPQSIVSWYQANAACENAGKRLCTFPEWGLACEGSSSSSYPYGATYESTTCNDESYGVAYDFGVLETGTLAGCVTSTGVFDLLGNVWEWTSTSAEISGSYLIHGGSYNMPPSTCAEEFNNEDPKADKETVSPNQGFDNGGFRCCR